MATIYSPKDNDSMAYALVQAYNQFHDRFAFGSVGGTGATGLSPSGYFHRDISSTVATGSDWQHPQGAPLLVAPFGATGATLLNQTLYNAILNVRGVLLTHFDDSSAHFVKDTTNATGLSAVTLPASATDYTGMIFMANKEQQFFNAHLTQSIASGCVNLGGLNPYNPYGPVGPVQVHAINDTVNTLATATAVGTGTAFAVVGNLASGITAHMANGVPFGRVKLFPE
jgi:hypothetical protein